MHETENCRLCNTPSPIFHIDEKRHYLKCPNCDGIFVSKQFLPDDVIEVNRYIKHNNDIHDPKYQKFVSPITNAIQNNFTENHQGLDFGSGPGPVITKILREQGYSIETYDPYFDYRPELLTTTYDYIVCCEVVEHFHQPYMEFQKLKSLLKPNGELFIMTDFYSDEIDFQNWYYKNDLTHIFFYQKPTFEWIKDRFGFSSIKLEGRLTILSS